MATKSIGSSGRDYATLALWAAYVNALTNISVAERGECYNDSEFTFSSKLTLGGWTLSGGSVTLACGSGQSFYDNAGKLTNALRYNQSNGVGVNSTVSYDVSIQITGNAFTMDGLQVKNTRSDAQGIIELVPTGTGGPASTLKRCIYQGNGRSTYTPLKIWQYAAENLLVITTSTSNGGITANSAGGNVPTLTDCTVISVNSSSGAGITSGYTNGCVAKNCAVAGFATDYSGTASSSSTNNATDKGSFGGTNWGGSGQTSLVATTEWQSVTAGSEDLRVKSTAVKLPGNGATTGPAIDIVGQTRSAPYTIGAWQYVAAGGSPVLITNAHP